MYNEVSYKQREQVEEMVQGFASGFDQMNFFSYDELYAVWQQADERQARDGNVLVYLDRITEPDGAEIVRYQAPPFLNSLNYGAAGAVMLQKLTNLCSC